jgi:hypothetical protein
MFLNDVNNCFTLFVANIIKCTTLTKAWLYLSAVYISGKVSRMSNMVVFVRLSGKTVVICLHLFEGSLTVNISRKSKLTAKIAKIKPPRIFPGLQYLFVINYLKNLWSILNYLTFLTNRFYI